MLSADAPVLVPKPHFISADLTPEDKHRVLSRSQFPRKYFFPSHKIPTFHLPPLLCVFPPFHGAGVAEHGAPVPRMGKQTPGKG